MTDRPRPEIQSWFEERLSKKPASQRGESIRQSRSYSTMDWEALYKLDIVFHLERKSREDLAALEWKEQEILRELPDVEQHGVRYSAPWTFGVRLKAAQELWGLETDIISRAMERNP